MPIPELPAVCCWEKGGIAEKVDLSSHLLSCIHLTWQKEAINEQEIYVKTCELFSRVGA
jgi:hypothetical protein